MCKEGQKWLPTTVFFPASAAGRSVCRNAVCCMCVCWWVLSQQYTHNTHCECERVQRIDFSRAVAFPAEAAARVLCVWAASESIAPQDFSDSGRVPRISLAGSDGCFAMFTIYYSYCCCWEQPWRESRQQQQSLPASPTLISKKALLFQRKQISAHKHRAQQTPF